MYKEEIETKDLVLKKASINDLNDMYKNMWSHEESAKYMLWIPTKNIEEAEERMKRTIEFQKDKIAYLVYEKKSVQAIGFAGMKEIEDKVYEDCGIGMGSKFVKHGYGKQILMALVEYCFEDLGAIKIICSCRSENIASKKLQQSCGFHYTHSQLMVDKRDGLKYMIDFYELTRNV
ncbi:MAG TPA: GNAT family N-acetyltransferase [Clostridiaceae bacterium]|jgi:RimJ/RimL family protein N-acetyltransferase|nr:GNAT family N-acetyltransferase [Clostridiaceae bacterium]